MQSPLVESIIYTPGLVNLFDRYAGGKRLNPDEVSKRGESFLREFRVESGLDLGSDDQIDLTSIKTIQAISMFLPYLRASVEPNQDGSKAILEKRLRFYEYASDAASLQYNPLAFAMLVEERARCLSLLGSGFEAEIYGRIAIEIYQEMQIIQPEKREDMQKRISGLEQTLELY